MVETVETGPRQVSRRVVVNAPAAEIFALLANPHRHASLDGSGTVRDVPVKGPHAGLPYSITSVVTAQEPDRLIEWQHPLGHRWRWELASAEPGATTVTETFDYSTVRSPRVMKLLGFPAKNATGITETLRALAARFPS